MSPIESELKQIQRKIGANRRLSFSYGVVEVRLLQKMERHQCRRWLSFNPRKRLMKLKQRLSHSFDQAVELEIVREELERESMRLSTTGGSVTGSDDHDHDDDDNDDDDDDDELRETRFRLEKERQDLLNEIVRPLPPSCRYKRLKSELDANHARELAYRSIRDQIQTLQETHTQALSLIRMSLVHMIDPIYESQLEQFVTGPYSLAVEAARLLKLASMTIQPDARRRYAMFAEPIANTKIMSFPAMMKEWARRPNAAVSKTTTTTTTVTTGRWSASEMQKKVEEAEHILVLMHQTIVRNIDLLDQWSDLVQVDSLNDRRNKRLMMIQLEECTQRILDEASVTP